MRSLQIEYRATDVEGPVFLAGSFTDPPWTLQQMQRVFNDQRRPIFAASVRIEPGQDYQFKFKLGTGDHWVVDESRPIGQSPFTLSCTNQTNPLAQCLIKREIGTTSSRSQWKMAQVTAVPTAFIVRPDRSPLMTHLSRI